MTSPRTLERIRDAVREERWHVTKHAIDEMAEVVCRFLPSERLRMITVYVMEE
ncbi:MAG: hypothetical protein ACE5I7_03135 [Candidatus Binatia bacterium]